MQECMCACVHEWACEDGVGNVGRVGGVDVTGTGHGVRGAGMGKSQRVCWRVTQRGAS
jgi:hypothetical protein